MSIGRISIGETVKEVVNRGIIELQERWDTISDFTLTLLSLTTAAAWRAALGASAGPIAPVIFNASGTFPTATSPNTVVLVKCKAGGGGGGGGSTFIRFGGGGGEGSTSWKVTTAGALSGQAVTIGAGGAAVAAGSELPGGNGSPSSIGTIVTANGGFGGRPSSEGGVGGAGGVGGTQDWSEPGIAGSVGETADGQKAIAPVGGGGGGGIVGASGAPNSGAGAGGGWAGFPSGIGGSGQIVCIPFGTI